MRIAILGTRGIPNHYGGFEQFAEYFASYLVKNNHDVIVYCSSSHPYKEKTYQGVKLIHCSDPECTIGTIGQFIYDLNCIIDSRTRDFDIILQLGYTSNSIWHKFLPKSAIVISNMDGLEWKRTKYSNLQRKFLKYAEKLAVKSSNFLISDSLGIKNYLFNEYGAISKYIAYGAVPFNSPNTKILELYNLKPNNYNMLVARLEPENNIETILDGAVLATNKTHFLVVGNHDSNKFGAYLKDKFKDTNNIRFIGGIYNLNHLNNLRYFSNLYFHGHSVGGTNPSLLEAMASKALIVAHENEFNTSILGENAFYFRSKHEVKNFIDSVQKEKHRDKIEKCFERINEKFNLESINKMYLDFFNECIQQN